MWLTATILAADEDMNNELQNNESAVAAQPGEADRPGRAEPIAESEQPARKVTSTPEGAKRGGYFKERDYGD